MPDRFANKVVVVTGAAGGIGRATSVRFASEGARVALVDLPGSALNAAASAVRDAGGEALVIPADVTRAAEVEGYVKEVSAKFGGIDCLFNNAGIEGYVGSLLDYSEEMFDKVLAVNVKGVWLGLKYAGPAMRARGGGAIVNTASVAGLRGGRTLFAYTASKHAAIGMTRSAALEFAAFGIRVNAICPGPIETRMMRALERGASPDNPQAYYEQTAARNPMQRYGAPEEVAALVAFLCSSDASYINGAAYPVDGGSTA